MSLDKAIQHGKEKRKPYRGWAAVDATMRNHGSDECGLSDRTISTQRREQSAKSKLEEYENGSSD